MKSRFDPSYRKTPISWRQRVDAGKAVNCFLKNQAFFQAQRVLSWICAISMFLWAFTDPRFRDAEGFLEGAFCLPVAISAALMLLGWSMGGRLRGSTVWLALALVGQAVALQMIEAGHLIHYQHYRPFYRLFTETHPLILIFFASQTALVFRGLNTRWPKIRAWLGSTFKWWQILGMGLVFFVSSATVSPKISNYIAELFFSVFVQSVNLGNIVLMVWAIPKEVLTSWKQKLDRFIGLPGREGARQKGSWDRFVLAAVCWVLVLTAVLNFFIYERHPHIPDEVVYLYQAQYFAKGMLTVPAPSVPEAFSFYMIPSESQRWYSIFPPGWPAVLALGVLLGVPWLINPMFAGLNVLLTYILFRDVDSRRTAHMAVFLLSVSPWYIFMGMNFMSHMFTLTCALLAAVAISRAKKTGKALWGWLGGCTVGLASLVRPLDGLIVAGVLAFWVIGAGGRRLKIASILGLVVGAVVVGAIVLPYNEHLIGDPLKFPLAAYYEEYFGPNVNALGFGPERGLGWAIDPFPGHSPIDALVNANLNTFSINTELFGWSTGSLLLIGIIVFSGRMRRGDYLMLGVTAAIIGTYSLYWFSGGPDFGARYWYLMILPLVALTISGLRVLQEKLEAWPSGAKANGTRAIIAVLTLSIFTLFNYLPWRAIDKYHHYRGMRPDIHYLAKQKNFGKSLVLVRGDAADYLSAWTYNPLDLTADAPVYAWDRNPEVRAKLLKAYPDRPIWIVNGPSISHRGYEAIEGPLLETKLLQSDYTQK